MPRTHRHLDRSRAALALLSHPRKSGAPSIAASSRWVGKHQLASALILIAAACTVVSAQSPCGLTSIKDTTPLVYPPIARAAHISGQIILLATFNLDGTVSQPKILSGPPMLRPPAIAYVKGWKPIPIRANASAPLLFASKLRKAQIRASIRSRRPSHGLTFNTSKWRRASSRFAITAPRSAAKGDF